MTIQTQIDNMPIPTATDLTMVSGKVYVPYSSGARVVFTLPTVVNVGDSFTICGQGSAGWRIKANADQYIICGSRVTTSGGFFDSASGVDAITVVCTLTGTGPTIELFCTRNALGAPFSTPINSQCGGRLTLSSTLPVTTADITGSTIYYLPYHGNYLTLYEMGGFSLNSWVLHTFSSLSIAAPVGANTVSDVFVYNNAGVLTLELTDWTNDTTRAVALTLTDGIYLKSTDLTRRYLGTVRTTSASTVVDSVSSRLVWNNSNRVRKTMSVIESTNDWLYGAGSVVWRQANANAANQLAYVSGLNEDCVYADVSAEYTNTAGGTSGASVSIGVDSTAIPSAQRVSFLNDIAANILTPTFASYVGYPGVGYHTLVWLEGSSADGKFFGGTAANLQSGITGTLLC